MACGGLMYMQCPAWAYQGEMLLSLSSIRAALASAGRCPSHPLHLSTSSPLHLLSPPKTINKHARCCRDMRCSPGSSTRQASSA